MNILSLTSQARSDRETLNHMSEAPLYAAQLVVRLGKLCQLCYAFGVNPLPALRRRFPEYQWRFFDDPAPGLFDAVFESDIVLDDGQGTYVIGKSELLQTEKFFWCEEGAPSASNLYAHQLQAAGFTFLPLSTYAKPSVS